MNALIRYLGPGFGKRFRTRILPNLTTVVTKSTVRRCQCCNRMSVFIQTHAHDESQICLRCSVSVRTELLALYVRKTFDIAHLDVLELDPSSPMRGWLSSAKTYTRSYFRPDEEPGSMRPDGSVMEDVTRLTYADRSLDLIISNDVLEHVPDAEAAFKETFRVLRPGGTHVFHVPSEPATVRRAVVEDGVVRHLVEPPEFHLDPLDPNGILAFWHFGDDLQEQFGQTGLQFRQFTVRNGSHAMKYWEARRPPLAA